MTINEMSKYIGKQYDIGIMMPELRKRYTLIDIYPDKATVLLDGDDGEDMFELSIKNFMFENYVKENGQDD